MGFFGLGQHDWFDLLQSVGIIASFLLSGAGFVLSIISFRRDKRARRFANRMSMGENHRELSVFEVSRDDLLRVREMEVDLARFPITPAEAIFIGERILHLSRYFQGIEEDELEKLEKLETDVRVFFARPLSQVVWKKTKPFQNERFVAFVEGCLKGTDESS
jgi:hypothetical protein